MLDAGTATSPSPPRQVEFRLPNVVGLLRGSDPDLRDEYVVFSARMDRVGTGAPDSEGDSIFNGADDDASGTATVVEVAEAFSALTVAASAVDPLRGRKRRGEGPSGFGLLCEPPAGWQRRDHRQHQPGYGRSKRTGHRVGHRSGLLVAGAPRPGSRGGPSRTGARGGTGPMAGREPVRAQRPLQLREERRGCASFSRQAFTTSTTSSRTRSS